MTRAFATLAAILLFVGVTNAQQTSAAKPTGAETTEATLIANERALQDAVARADKASFQSLVLPEGVWTTKRGFVALNLLVNGLDSFNITEWDIVNPHVTWLDTDSAVLLYVWRGAGTLDNQPLASTSLASTVWTRRNGKWLAVHHQETDLTK